MTKIRINTTSTNNKKRGRPFKVELKDAPLPEPEISFDDFYQTMVLADDLMSRCQMLYVCTGNTLDVVTGKVPQFTNPLTFAVLESQFTRYADNTLKDTKKAEYVFDDKKVQKIILPMGIINVEIAVIPGNHRPIKNFDLKYFNYDIWRIPNPIEEFNRIMKEIYG